MTLLPKYFYLPLAGQTKGYRENKSLSKNI